MPSGRHGRPWRGPARPRAGSREERSNEGQDLGAVLDAVVAGRPWASGMTVGDLARRWEQVVGERLARECRPAGLQGGVLVVKASSGPWAAQVRFLARDVASRANEVLGQEVVREVRVAVDPDPAGP